MEAGEYGLTRGMCVVESCLEVVAVAGLLWISRCVLGGANFFRVFFFSSNAHEADFHKPRILSLIHI